MDIFQSIILGIVQGLTEFIPVSSSGHLVILPKLFSWGYHPLVLDTTLHLGTSLALIVYFYKDIKDILVSFVSDVKVVNYKKVVKEKNLKEFFKIKFSSNSNLGFKIVVASIPAILLGLVLNDYFEFIFRELHWVIIFLTVGSLLMYLAEYLSSLLKLTKFKNIYELTYLKAFIIGVFQSFALFPGVSRSGSTLSGGMFLGLNRESAAKFSFLLSIPVILGAGVYQLISTPLHGINLFSLLLGFLFSFLAGIFAIRFLLKYLKTNKLYPFIIYRVILAFILLFFI